MPEPLENPDTLGEDPLAVQEYVEPGTVEVGTIFVGLPEQTWKFVTGLLMAGVGLTVTTTFCEGPGGHPKAAGVTWYVTVSIVFPEFESVWTIELPDPPEYPEIFPDEAEAVHVNVAPGTEESTWMFVACWEQRVCAGGLKYTSGVCTTVTVKSVSGPLHPFAVGVM